MPDGLIALCGILAILLGGGVAVGLIDRRRFDIRWLIAAAALVALNDLLLTRGYGLIPRLLPPGSGGNWQGKAMALTATLIVASIWGWRPCGLTLRQKPGSLRVALPVVAVYGAIFLVLAILTPDEHPTPGQIAFQLTMPGFEEEPFYRGVLLFALDRAFTGRVRLLGTDWGWGGLLSCVLFGLAHAFGYEDGAFSFDALTMALTGGPALIAVWLRYRTGSVLLPIVMHNFGNSISFLA